MRLLFITQKVDKNDDILGIYHRWIEELAIRVEKLTVICLYRGRVELPENVGVYSLGKEKIANRFFYLARLYFYIWRFRNDYDTVFVHMNPEYVLLGGCFWKLFRKKIFLWYNHPLGGLRVRLAVKFCRKVFHTSPFAFAARFRHSEIMPAGIDVGMFQRDPRFKKQPDSILYLGRISPVKNIECLIEALKILGESGSRPNLKIVGSPARLEDYDYEKKIKFAARDLINSGQMEFIPAVPNQETPKIYNSNEIVVNLTDTGSFDKAMLEAMACENLILVSNRALEKIVPPPCFFKEKNSRDLAVKIEELLKFPLTEKEGYGRKFRNYVVQNHDLKILMNRLVLEISV